MYTFTWIPVRPSRVESVRTGGVPTSVSKFARFLFNFHIAYMEARTRSSSTEFESQISAASGFIPISGIDFSYSQCNILLFRKWERKSRGIYFKKKYIFEVNDP